MSGNLGAAAAAGKLPHGCAAAGSSPARKKLPATVCTRCRDVSSGLRTCFAVRRKPRPAPLGMTARRVSNMSCTASSSSSPCSRGGGAEARSDAGVAGTELSRSIAKMAPFIGGFGVGDSYYIAAENGVGTKLKLAFETGCNECE